MGKVSGPRTTISKEGGGFVGGTEWDAGRCWKVARHGTGPGNTFREGVTLLSQSLGPVGQSED